MSDKQVPGADDPMYPDPYDQAAHGGDDPPYDPNYADPFDHAAHGGDDPPYSKPQAVATKARLPSMIAIGLLVIVPVAVVAILLGNSANNSPDTAAAALESPGKTPPASVTIVALDSPAAAAPTQAAPAETAEAVVPPEATSVPTLKPTPKPTPKPIASTGPEKSAEPAPEPSADTATPAPTSPPLIVIVTNVANPVPSGGQASVTVKADAATECKASVSYSNDPTPLILAPQAPNADGRVTWSWKVPDMKAGSALVTVTCTNTTLTATAKASFDIQ